MQNKSNERPKLCKNCKNSKIIVDEKDRVIEYTYDENGNETVSIIYKEKSK